MMYPAIHICYIAPLYSSGLRFFFKLSLEGYAKRFARLIIHIFAICVAPRHRNPRSSVAQTIEGSPNSFQTLPKDRLIVSMSRSYPNLLSLPELPVSRIVHTRQMRPGVHIDPCVATLSTLVVSWRKLHISIENLISDVASG